MPPKTKKPHASPHDKRHENGLAPPGKRIVKSRSNGNLNGSPNGAVVGVVQSFEPEAATEIAQNPSQSYSTYVNGADQRQDGAIEGFRHEYDRAFHDFTRVRNFEGTATPPDFDADHPSSRSGQRTPIHGNSSQAAKIIDLHPFQDVIAILLLLLFLPPWAVTIVHAGYAALTFSPPSSGWSLSSLTSSHEWLHSSGGKPSLVTTGLSDFAALMLWLMMPLGQDLVLDLALGVIAISLGGGVSNKSGSTSTILVCLGMIGLYRLFRYEGPRHYTLNALWLLLVRTPFKNSVGLQPPTISEYNYTPHGWPRTLLELHILAQGAVKIVRRHLSEPRGRGGDLDLTGIQNTITSPATSNDTIAEGARNNSTDGRPPGPPPAVRDANRRRRRKHATQVRSQQPFWAALASSKISLFKDQEAKSALIDSSEAGAKDILHLGDGSLNASDDQVWIEEVSTSEVRAVAIMPTYHIDPSVFRDAEYEKYEDETQTQDERNLNPVKILVNGAIWNSTLSRYSLRDEHTGNFIWQARIFGLTEATTYLIQFFRASQNVPFYSASVITRPAASNEQSSGVSASNPQSLRPLSPTTTLRKSILAAEASLAEQRLRVKTKKKDYRHSGTNLKRDVDILSSRLSTAGGHDEKLRQRQLQIQQQVRQAEDALASMSTQLETFADIPQEEADAATTSKANWQVEQDRLKAAECELASKKGDADHQVVTAEAEKATAVLKQERLAARLLRLTQQYDQSASTHADKVKRDQDRASILFKNRQVEKHYKDSINSFQSRLEDVSQSNYQLQQQIDFLRNIHGPHSMSSIPESPDFPISVDNSQSPMTAFPGYQLPFVGPQLSEFNRSRASSMRGSRERASSMLSNVSGLTEETTNYNSLNTSLPSNFHSQKFSPGSAAAELSVEDGTDRKGSDGSGGSSSWKRSGSGSGSGSHRS